MSAIPVERWNTRSINDAFELLCIGMKPGIPKIRSRKGRKRQGELTEVRVETGLARHSHTTHC